MLASVSSTANDVFGALAALANPALVARSQRPTAAGEAERSGAVDPSPALGGKAELTDEERKEVEELQKRDREVRRHEQAHQAAAGQYSRGGPRYEYETGPDGRQYATGGEVSIDTSEVPGDPEATVRKMQTVRRAALAPADPSGQDRRVASKAAQQQARAQAEVAQQRTQEQQESQEPGQAAGEAQRWRPAVGDAPAGHPPSAADADPDSRSARATRPADDPLAESLGGIAARGVAPASSARPAEPPAPARRSAVAPSGSAGSAAAAFSVATLDAPGRFIDVRA